MQTIIYGAGDYGRRLLRLFQSLGVTPDCFCQTEAKDGETVEGIPVISFAKLCERQDKFNIFIAINNKVVSRNIKLRLTSVFLDKAEVYETANLLDKPKNYAGGYIAYCAGATRRNLRRGDS